MCEQMSIVSVCSERFVAMRMRTLFLLDLLALMLGELVLAESTVARKIFLALIAFVSFLFMNILNVLSQIVLPRKLVLTTTADKTHICLSCSCPARFNFNLLNRILIVFVIHAVEHAREAQAGAEQRNDGHSKADQERGVGGVKAGRNDSN